MNSFTLICCNVDEYKADLEPTVPMISSHTIRLNPCFQFLTQASWLSLILPFIAKADQYCSYDFIQSLITKPKEPFDFADQSSVFGRAILKKLTLEKVITVLPVTGMVIELITIQGQDFGHDWMTNGETIGGSNLSTFVGNIFVDLSIGWEAFIASHQD